ncbi:MAG: TetR family transcriptional regulator [Xanthobacteraceae bacterium]|nr:TetR family transcriptional regulator [Xanthobacteraceae bacterium]MBX3522937.1 TetR family transcriptional regulator [Xanthobacteraceae bacterium]MBX3535272.1 TetR family transcriptional regulator [Xanthobacteraceae bacterium]MBX3548424.1 TetR family transcriptional regulator [Xanthobacteraceae bacterium]MCW5674064.1 TetR family transcriptional regulator [Xanthobacteraceae bacterium]
MATALAAKKAAPKRANGNARDPERTRAVILAAATAEITAKGLGGARVDEIAERAGVNKRMIYHYFGDKDGLYLAVLEAAYQLIRSEEIKLDLKQRDPVEGMRELVQFTWNYYRLHPEFLSLLATENLHRSAYLKRSKKIRELHSPLVGLIEDLLQRGAKTKVFRKDVDPVELYISIAALGFFYLSNRYTLSTIFGRDLTAPDSIKARGRHLVEVVLGYLRP